MERPLRDERVEMGRLEVQHFAEARAEIHRDGTLVLTRTAGDWEALFGMESVPPAENGQIIFRL